MAERRMFAKTIIDSDAFLDMPLSAQSLYFHLSMRADDDGFINNPKKIQRMIGAADDDLKLLAAKRFIIPFETGVCVIKHWLIHNYIRPDRYKPTVYQDERNSLFKKENSAYSLNPPTNQDYSLDVGMSDGMTVGIPYGGQVVDQPDTQVRLGKDRLGQVRVGKDNSDIMPGAETTPDQQPTQPTRSPGIVITITLNDKTEYPISEDDIAAWKNLYPAVDVLQELRKMKGWSDANPAKRKTSRGIKRFINSWLAREQDSYHGTTTPAQEPPRGGYQNGNVFLDMLNERRGNGDL